MKSKEKARGTRRGRVVKEGKEGVLGEGEEEEEVGGVQINYENKMALKHIGRLSSVILVLHL